MSALLEFDLVRLTAQSTGQNPKEPGGGKPEYTKSDILACAAEMPHLAWHCVMAKYCDDKLSERELLNRAHRMSVAEWFDNPEHRTKSIKAGQLIRVAELAVLAYLMPACQHAVSYGTRALYAGCRSGKWQDNFQSHYEWIVSELDYQERIAAKAYRLRKKGPSFD